MNTVDAFQASQCRKDIPDFRVGDTVRVHQKIVEGARERVQVFEGVVIGRKGGSSTETFTVRRISFGIGVERIYPVHSPRIEKIEVTARGRIRRAKLYYLRDRIGKRARVKSKQLRKGEVLGAIPETKAEPEAVEIAEALSATEVAAAEAAEAAQTEKAAKVEAAAAEAEATTAAEAAAPAPEAPAEEPAAEPPAEEPAADAPAEDAESKE